MMEALVIGLERKPERMAAFVEHMHDLKLDEIFQFTPFAAIDGHQLDLESLNGRLPDSNWEQRERIRGILGCALSHLECWRRIANGSEPVIRSALKNLPSDATLVWLNDYNYWNREGLRHRLQRKLRAAVRRHSTDQTSVEFSPMPDILNTMESYVLFPQFAEKIYDAMVNNIGAIDRYLQVFVANSKERTIQCHPGLFTQADRTDSSTQF